MTSPNRPPSCDILKPKLKECPFCDGDDIMVTPGPFLECQECGAEAYGSDWNKAIRRSEVAELLRLVGEVLKAPIYYANPQPFADLDNLKEYADRLRKEMKL